MVKTDRMSAVTQAVLLSCHGTVENLDDLGAFLLRIRRGRAVPDELLREVRHASGVASVRTRAPVPGRIHWQLAQLAKRST